MINQEKLKFPPTKLTATFEEIAIKTEDGVNLNNLLFRADSAKGVVFYLHVEWGFFRKVWEIGSEINRPWL